MAEGRKQNAGKAANSNDSTYATPALEKGLDVLELLAHQRDGLTKSEIARGLDRTISEIFRMLLTLERRGYITQMADDRYVLSLRLFQLVQEHPLTERLLAEALPRMHALAERIEQSCHLGVVESGRVAVLAQANAPGSVGFFVKQGATVDLMEAATGQVILAHLPKDLQARALAEWRKVTGRRIPSDLLRHLERIRSRGHEKRASYQVKGVTNISFPVFDSTGRAIAALTVPFLQRLHTRVKESDVERSLAETARAISQALGGR